MDTVRIAALLEPFLERPLAPSQLDQISTYIDLLLRWNARINLTAIRQEEEIVTRHFGESFFLARNLFPYPSNSGHPSAVCHPEIKYCHPERSEGSLPSPPTPEGATSKLLLGAAFGGSVSSSTPPEAQPTDHRPLTTAHCLPRVIDIGSGAGFPALPLKIWAPHIHLTLIESNHKKAAFLREVARALTLTDINVISDRAETVSAQPNSPQAEVVTLRAVENFERILPQAQAFLAPNGSLALLIGTAQLPLLATLTTLRWHPPISVPKSHSRVLSISVRG